MLSGKDERRISIYPPECPVCCNCREWYVGPKMWILTEESMKTRGLLYPIIAPTIPSLSRLSKTGVECIGGIDDRCGIIYPWGSDTYKAVIKAFRANYRKMYHKFSYGGLVTDEWY